MALTSSLVIIVVSVMCFLRIFFKINRSLDALCVRRQNVIRPMSVRPDGTLAPLEETLRVPEDHSGSDSD